MLLQTAMFQHDWQASGTRIEQILVDVGVFADAVDVALDRAVDVVACCGMKRATLRRSLVVVLASAAFMVVVFALVVGLVCCLGGRRGASAAYGAPTYRGLGGGRGKGAVLAF
jgi:hypothetical protein